MLHAVVWVVWPAGGTWQASGVGSARQGAVGAVADRDMCVRVGNTPAEASIAAGPYMGFTERVHGGVTSASAQAV